MAEDGNNGCRLKRNFSLQAAGRPGAREAVGPRGDAGTAVTHQQPHTRALLIKGQTEPAGKWLMEVTKGHRGAGATGRDFY